jgi:taurine transport system substrate-binding protein
MVKRPIARLAVSVTVLLLLAWSASALAQTAPAKLLGPVEVGSGIDAAYAQFVVAERHGFWKTCGVDVRLKLFPSGQEALEAVLANRLAMTLNGQANHPIAHSKGGKVYMIAENERSGVQFGAAGVGIKAPKDLEGKTVGTQFGTSPEYHMRRYFEHYGLDPNRLTVKNVQFADLMPALAKGDIQAFFAFDPHLTRAAKEVPNATVFHRSGEDNVFFLRTYLGVSETVVNDPKLAQALVCGVVKAGEWVNAHRREAAEILAPRARLKLEEALVFINYFDYGVTFNDASVDELRGVEKFFRGKGIITGPITYRTLVRPEFLEAASPSRVLITGDNATLLGK